MNFIAVIYRELHIKVDYLSYSEIIRVMKSDVEAQFVLITGKNIPENNLNVKFKTLKRNNFFNTL